MEDVRELAMFPLGSVLFPAMPLPLRVFEERYLQMLQDIFQDEPAEFGVVLIERGQEVGGGEHRFEVGTTARVAELGTGEGFVTVMAQGGDRIEVVEWLDDDPYPRAMVRTLPDLTWDPQLADARDDAEDLVRKAIARASEFCDIPWSSDVELADDPVASAWQLAGITPVGTLDQLSLLRSTSADDLIEGIVIATIEAADLSFPGL